MTSSCHAQPYPDHVQLSLFKAKHGVYPYLYTKVQNYASAERYLEAVVCTDDRWSVLESFDIDSFLILPTLYEEGDWQHGECNQYLICPECPSRPSKTSERDELQFRRALIALRLNSNLVKDVKGYECGCCDIDHEIDED